MKNQYLFGKIFLVMQKKKFNFYFFFCFTYFLLDIFNTTGKDCPNSFY